MQRAMAKPSPVPPVSWDRAASASRRTKGGKCARRRRGRCRSRCPRRSPGGAVHPPNERQLDLAAGRRVADGALDQVAEARRDSDAWSPVTAAGSTAPSRTATPVPWASRTPSPAPPEAAVPGPPGAPAALRSGCRAGKHQQILGDRIRRSTSSRLTPQDALGTRPVRAARGAPPRAALQRGERRAQLVRGVRGEAPRLANAASSRASISFSVSGQVVELVPRCPVGGSALRGPRR